MSALSYDLNTVEVLWRRDVKRFTRQPSRIISAIGQPLIFWFVLGAGLGATFSIPGLDVDYMEFFFPGVVTMMLLFASIFAAVSVIDDRNQGFLQSVLAGPASRPAMVLGKCLGATTVALIQAGLFIALAPLAGFQFGNFDWPMLLGTMALASFGLTALGFSVAWALNNMQAYHAVQMTILVPLWIVSGAMFPAQVSHPVFATIMAFNPVAYAVSAVRHALYGGLAPTDMTLTQNPMFELGVVLGFAVVTMLLASLACRRTS